MEDELVLNITLEGTEPGLIDGRLGLSFFADSFRDLLRAYRGIATMLISSAHEDNVNVRAQGRKPRLAEQMDLEIDRITHDSPAAIRLICTVPRTTQFRTNELFAREIVKRSAIELVESVESEAHGRARNKYIRRFLQQLPRSTRKQTWDLYENGVLVKKITLGSLEISALEPETTTAGIIRADGRLSGIYFPPNAEIRIAQGEEQFWFKASDQLIEVAISLRNVPVEAVGLQSDGKHAQLIWIRPKSESTRRDRAQRDLYFAKKWAGVLLRLAK